MARIHCIPTRCPISPLSETAAHPGKEAGDPRAGEETCTTALRRSWTKQRRTSAGSTIKIHQSFPGGVPIPAKISLKPEENLRQ